MWWIVVVFIIAITILTSVVIIQKQNTKVVYVEKESKENKKNKDDMENEKKNTFLSEELTPSMLVNEIDAPLYNPIDIIFDTHERDKLVLNNAFVPMLNRSSLPRGMDSYRMIGYLVGEEQSNEKWQLFGRESMANNGEFYVRPTDRNTEMKITLTNDMMPNIRHRLRKVDDLPENIIIDHPLFDTQTYKVVAAPYNYF
jgi:hypothetical protein